MKFRLAVSALLVTVGSIAYGQAVPAGGTPTSVSSTGWSPFSLAPDGILHYALSAAEVVQLGYFTPGEVTYSTVLSGDVSYTAKSEVHPFNMLLGGGVFLGDKQVQGGASGYANMAISQGYISRTWDLNISDSFNFLPQSPTTGLSGIAGVGDLGSLPVTGPVQGPAGGIFSNAGNRIANTLSGSAERQISSNTSISGSAFWSILHFLDDDSGQTNNGLDSTQISGTVSLNRRLDARSSISVDAVYSTFSYTGINSGIGEPDVESRGLNLTYRRTLTRTLSVALSGGPQWTSSSNSTFIPSSLNAAGTASLSYTRELTNASVGYSRGVNAGSGVLPGALSDSFFAYLGHTYGRKWVVSLNAGYSRTSGLTQLTSGTSIVPTNQTYDTVFGGAQVTRAFGTHFSGYVSYTGQNQSNNFLLNAQNALNGTAHTFGVGVTFTPRSTTLGQF